MRLRRFLVLASFLLGAIVAGGCVADEVAIDTRPCGEQPPKACSYGGCVRFCSEADGCLCLNRKRAACDQSCEAGCTVMANAPTDDAYDPFRFVCTSAITESLAEREAARPE